MRDAGIFIRKQLIFLAAFLVFAAGCAGGASSVRQNGAEPLAKLENIEFKEGSTNTTVIITTDRPVSFTSVRINEPPRMVIDLAGMEQTFREPMKVGKGGIDYITANSVEGSKKLVRLEVGMSSPLMSKSAQDGQKISIVFEKKAEAESVAAPSSPSEKVETADAAKEDAPVKPESVEKEQAPEVKAASQNSVDQAVTSNKQQTADDAGKEAALPQAKVVNSVTFSKEGEGFAVRIEGDGNFGKKDVFKLGADRLVVDLPEMGSSKDKFAIEVGGKCLKKVRLASHQQPRKVRVVLDLGCAADYSVKNDGKALVVSVAPAGSAAKAAKAIPQAPVKAEPVKAAISTAVAGGEGKPSVALKAEAKTATPKPVMPINVYISKTGGKAVLSSVPIEEPEGMTKAPGDTRNYVETATKIYTGGRVSFDIQDAELDDVMQLLADVAGLNIIMDTADVKGKVTLKLDNVPWDQALDILLRIYNLDKVIEGNVLRVAAKAKLDDEKRRDLLQVAEQKKLEQQAEDLYTKTFKVNYTTATDLEPKIKKILTPRGDATANPRTNELIVTDVRDTLFKAEQLIKMLDKEVNQIMIEARIVTVDVGYSQSLGVSWGLTKKGANNPNFGFAQGDASSVKVGNDGPNGSHSYELNLPSELAAAAGGLVGAMTWGNLLKDINLDLTISALESIDKAETLASPKVFTLENQAATITSGTTLYVQTTSASGTKPEPLNANLSLTVTPRVTGDNFIMMDVTATNNQPAVPPPGSTAAINTQAVTTSVLVKNGDTVVLGGIYTKNKSHGDSHIPLLGRIPIIKYLFSTNNWTDKTSELLIFITPKLVRQSNQV